MRHAAAAALLLAACIALVPAAAQVPPGVAVEGRVTHPATLGLDTLRALPPVTLASRFDTEHGPEAATYVGALLWTLLERAHPIDAAGRRTFLQHTVLAEGRDGYAVALAIAEIDPAFEGKPVIVAYQRDGRALSSPRLVVPGDRHGGRSVKDLVSLDVR